MGRWGDGEGGRWKVDWKVDSRRSRAMGWDGLYVFGGEMRRVRFTALYRIVMSCADLNTLRSQSNSDHRPTGSRDRDRK